MDPYELKEKLLAKNKNSHFFDEETMECFGDSMENYGVQETVIDTYSEKAVKVWELYRIEPVKHGLQSSAYFTLETFEQKWPKKEWEK